MPKDTFRQAPLRLLASATAVAVCLYSAPLFAQATAQPTVNDRQVQAFFNGIALDQQLAEQYGSPAPPAVVTRPADAKPPGPAAMQSIPTPQSLEKPLDAALDDAALDKLDANVDAAVGEQPTTIAEVPPSPAHIALLVLASLALLAFAGSVLALAVRELKKDAQERKRTYRRHVRHRDTSTPAHAS